MLNNPANWTTGAENPGGDGCAPKCLGGSPLKTLHELSNILKAVAQDVDVLPTVGGAVEDLERSGFEEREDQALNEDRKAFTFSPTGQRNVLSLSDLAMFLH